jgi:hypothetical protein
MIFDLSNDREVNLVPLPREAVVESVQQSLVFVNRPTEDECGEATPPGHPARECP